MSTLGDALRAATGRLSAAGVEAARLDARVLIAHALGIEPLSVVTRQERVLTAEDEAAVEALIVRREHREPVSHIIGRREFWSLSFTVTAATLAPRPDSETVIETALDHIADRQAPLRVLDFGTGTGCLLLALLSELPNARGIGIDRSQDALSVAGDNARRLGLAQRAEFRLGDWGRGLDGLFDVIISNPPYIPDQDIPRLEPEVARHEPYGALAGGRDGLDCYRVLAPDVKRLLVKDGIAVFEGGQGQAERIVRILSEAGLELAETRVDLGGVARAVAVRPARIAGE